jgi:hypothetical protein
LENKRKEEERLRKEVERKKQQQLKEAEKKKQQQLKEAQKKEQQRIKEETRRRRETNTKQQERIKLEIAKIKIEQDNRQSFINNVINTYNNETNKDQKKKLENMIKPEKEKYNNEDARLRKLQEELEELERTKWQ